MSHEGNFWRNVVIIGVAHAVILSGVYRLSSAPRKPLSRDIVWMEGGAGEPVPDAVAPAMPPSSPQETPEPLLPLEPAEESDPPIQMPAVSEAELPTPAPIAEPSATPRPTATASPKGSPKPTPKSSPRPTPRKSPASKASPKPKATASPTKKITPKAGTPAGGASGPSVGTAERGNGSGSASQFGWYGSMLHDRFFGEWAQPTSIAMSGARMAALVRIRIEKDGHISDFSIARSSGNVVVDESVSAIAKRVTQVDPPPTALINGGHYDVQINFELNPE